MSGKYLLDTNIVIAQFQGEQPILDKITQFKSVFTPRIGKPIPENDIWIAATAMQYNLTLITRDSHFNYVSGLSFEMIEEA